MAHESLLAFLAKASQDTALQEQLNGAADAEAVTSVAHAAGCTDVSADQVTAFLAEVASQRDANGDQELEGVTGGLSKGAKISLGVGGALTGLVVAGHAYAMSANPQGANASSSIVGESARLSSSSSTSFDNYGSAQDLFR